MAKGVLKVKQTNPGTKSSSFLVAAGLNLVTLGKLGLALQKISFAIPPLASTGIHISPALSLDH